MIHLYSMPLDVSQSNSQQWKIHTSFLKKILSILFKSRIRFAIIVIASVFSRLIIAMFPFGIKYGIDVIQHKPVRFEIFGFLLAQWNNVLLWQVISILIILFCIQFVLRYVQITMMSKFGHIWTRNIRQDLWNHLLKQRIQFFDRYKTGQLSSRVVYDTKLLNRFLVYNLPAMVSDALLIVLVVLAAFMMNVKLALFNFIIIPVLAVLMFIFRRTVNRLFHLIQKKMADMNVFLQNFIGGIRLIHAFQRESILKRQFANIQKEYIRAYLKTIKVYAMYFASVDLLGNLFHILIIVMAFNWVWQVDLPISSLIAFLFYFPILFMSVRSIAEHYQMCQPAFASGDRVMELLQHTHSEYMSSPSTVPADCDGAIEFRDVSLEYRSGYRVLDSISFSIHPGERVILIGQTGSGKTSIINLLSRIYDPTEGQILIDGVDYLNISHDTLHQWIVYVPQEAFIFSDTLRHNLTLFDQNVSDEQIQNACDVLNVPFFCDRFEQKYNMKLGERGQGISSGERQLISLVRGFISDFRIIVLDEIMVNLNIQIQQQIRKNIDAFIGQRTTIIIAHRWVPLNRFDRVFHVKSGRLTELSASQIACLNLY